MPTLQALPGQETPDGVPSFKLVLVGDGGTGALPDHTPIGTAGMRLSCILCMIHACDARLSRRAVYLNCHGCVAVRALHRPSKQVRISQLAERRGPSYAAN